MFDEAKYRFRYCRRKVKQFFCLHYPVNFLMECDKCGKAFSRKPCGQMCGLDYIKARFNQWRCRHTFVSGGLHIRRCSKCYLSQCQFRGANRIIKLKQFFCFHKGTTDITNCSRCGKWFSRRCGWRLCGLDLLKLKINRLFCSHDYRPSGFPLGFQLYCTKCDKGKSIEV